MKLLYIAGKFSADSWSKDPLHDIEEHITIASRYALEASRKGWAVFCPHKNSAGFQHAAGITKDQWYAIDIEILSRCDAVLFVPGWRESFGAREEMDFAQRNHIKVLLASRFIEEIPRPEDLKW